MRWFCRMRLPDSLVCSLWPNEDCLCGMVPAGGIHASITRLSSSALLRTTPHCAKLQRRHAGVERLGSSKEMPSRLSVWRRLFRSVSLDRLFRHGIRFSHCWCAAVASVFVLVDTKPDAKRHGCARFCVTGYKTGHNEALLRSVLYRRVQNRALCAAVASVFVSADTKPWAKCGHKIGRLTTRCLSIC